MEFKPKMITYPFIFSYIPWAVFVSFISIISFLIPLVIGNSRLFFITIPIDILISIALFIYMYPGIIFISENELCIKRRFHKDEILNLEEVVSFIVHGGCNEQAWRTGEWGTLPYFLTYHTSLDMSKDLSKGRKLFIGYWGNKEIRNVVNYIKENYPNIKEIVIAEETTYKRK